MGNEERTNIVPTILLRNLYGGLPNELFNLNEKEDSTERVREADEERNFSGRARRTFEPIRRENQASREIRIIIFATRYCHLWSKEYTYHDKIVLDIRAGNIREVYVLDSGEAWRI